MTTQKMCVFSSFISKANLTKILETIFQITRQTLVLSKLLPSFVCVGVSLVVRMEVDVGACVVVGIVVSGTDLVVGDAVGVEIKVVAEVDGAVGTDIVVEISSKSREK